MHIQDPIPNWLDGVAALPMSGSVKGFGISTLISARQKWAQLGRSRAGLITVLRYADFETAPRNLSLADRKAHQRAQILKFVDKTYLQSASAVTLVEGSNEFTANSTWESPGDTQWALDTMEAAVGVWNDEFRGRQVQTADGGDGFIPASTKMTILSGPVGNGFPVEVFGLASKYDAPINYHAYAHCVGGNLVGSDYVLWDQLEQEYGIKVEWFFGECGPYLDTQKGWKDPGCLQADFDKYLQVMTTVKQAWQSTAAYAENRIFGTGAWFTCRLGNNWLSYQLLAPHLVRLAQLFGDWRSMPTPSDQMHSIATGLRAYADQLDTLANVTPAPTPKHMPYLPTGLKRNQDVINFFHGVFGDYNELAAVGGVTYLHDHQNEPYAGPAIEDMALTDAQKQSLLAALPS